MKKISQLLENSQDNVWEVKVEVSLFITSANEGEAAFLAQDSLDKITYDKEITITEIVKKDLS